MITKGQKINDRYEVRKLIGEGGMANVYLGYDTILERDVAIKVLRGDLSDDEKFVRRFRREAQNASLLNHPNIVQIYDVGEDDGNFYIVMEYIKGQTLKQLIKKRGKLSVHETIDIMCQLTDGLAHAHDSYIIHRDIKPQNIMILDDGMVKITDFGIAMALNASDLTQTNSVMGSVHYLPPEQASGKGSTIKSDIYSLGIVMYEMLAGTMPFRGETAVEIAMKHLKNPIPSLRKDNPQIPQSIENIILRATAKNTKNRYNNVREVYDDLKTCLDKSRKDEKRIVFKYPENEYDDENTKVVDNLKDEIKEKEKEDSKNKKAEVLEVKEIDENEFSDKKISLFTKILIGLVGTLVLALFVVFIVFPKINVTSDVKVPDVSGLTRAAARQKLQNLGFEVNEVVKKDYTSDIDKGKVSKTSPKAGEKVKKGAKITMYESTGSDEVKLEDYTGQDANKVQAKLELFGLNVLIEKKKIDKRDDYVGKENIILDQNPKKDTVLVLGDTITLYVPNMADEYPDMVKDGYNRKTADEFCKKYKLNCTFNEQPRDDIEPGMVVSQSRPKGEEIIERTDLTITVSKKIEQVPITPEEPATEETTPEENTEGTN